MDDILALVENLDDHVQVVGTEVGTIGHRSLKSCAAFVNVITSPYSSSLALCFVDVLDRRLRPPSRPTTDKSGW